MRVSSPPVLGAIRLSTSTSQDLSSTSPAQERSDEQAPREWCGSPSETKKTQNKKRDGKRDSDDRLRDLPEWLEEFTGFRGQRNVCTRTHVSGLGLGMAYESGIKIREAQYLYSLPKRPKLRSLRASQDEKGSLQKTHWRSSTLSRKVW